MENSIYNQDLNRIEIAILDYLDLNKFFFAPQRELAEAIGYSRVRTNINIQSLRRKGLIVVLSSKHLNKKQKLITLSAKVANE